MLSCFKGEGGGGKKSRQSPVKVNLDADPNEHRDCGGDYSHTRSIVYGRDEDRNQIKAILLDTSGGGGGEGENTRRSQVVPIVGIAGIGKTTLARYVYNDQEVVDRFGLRRWVVNDDNLEIGSVARKLLGQIRDAADTPTLLEQLVEFVARKTFQFVLDDVWDDGVDDLVRLTERLLEAGAQGSKIIVTTRSEGVALRFPCRGTLYQLQGMSVEDCWQLFKSRAFSAGREETPQLERIGREMIRKFQGVPLIALALGSLLRFEDDRSYWQKVEESEIWSMPDLASRTLSALRLSYDRLPPHLKRCFEYCSLFPKGLGIQRDLLVELWTSEGIVPTMDLEDPTTDHIGGEYFEQLVFRSFFQEEEKSEYHDPTRRAYTMHSLYHDLAQSIVGEKVRNVDPKHHHITAIPEGCLRLGVTCEWLTASIPKIPRKKASNLETLVLVMRDYWVDPMHKCQIDAVPAELLSSLRCLRVLNLSYIGITELPKSVGRLRHLTYLNLSHTGIEELPESIGYLKALEWLILRWCEKLFSLPVSIKKLRNLRVLDISSCILLEELPEGVSNLEKLRTLRMEGFTPLLNRMPRGMGRMRVLRILSKFIVDEEHGCSLAELERLDGLSGEILISRLERLENGDVAVATKANLKGKSQLRRLELYWTHLSDPGLDAAATECHVLEKLQPHANIKELAIGAYAGAEWPTWMSTAAVLRNLVDFKLSLAFNCNHLPPLGILPCLKFLKIEMLDAVTLLGPETYGGAARPFPKLEELEICNMCALEEWSVPATTAEMGLNEPPFPRLNYLEIHQCPKLTKLPPLRFPLLDLLRVSESSAELLSETSLSKVALPSLHELIIVRIQAAAPFRWEGLRHVTTLKILRISHCQELDTLPDSIQHLSSLRSLELRRCPSIAELPHWLDFSSLESLELHFCTKIAQLPESLRRLRGLTTVEIHGGTELWTQYSVGIEDWGRQNGLTRIRNIKLQMWADLTADSPETEWDGAIVGRGPVAG